MISFCDSSGMSLISWMIRSRLGKSPRDRGEVEAEEHPLDADQLCKGCQVFLPKRD